MTQRRRQVLKGLCASSLFALAGCIGDDEQDDSDGGGTNDADVEPGSGTDANDERADDREELGEIPDNGVVAMVYHDGPIEDYTQAFPAHQTFEMPATTCVVTDWIGTTRYFGECMDWDHLDDLHAAGWEIGSHTTDHATLGEFELVSAADTGDHRVFLEEFRHGHHPGKTVEIVGVDSRELHTVAGLGDSAGGDRYVEFETTLETDFAAGESVVRYPEDEILAMLEEPRMILEDRGFGTYTLLAPYDNFGEYAMQFVPDYYECVANASLERPRINYQPAFDPFELRHRYFIEFTTRENVQNDLNEIAETGALGVLGAHTFKDEVTEARIHDTLEWIEDRDIEVMTLRDAVELYRANLS